jgi:hypothetical protein
MLVPWESLHDNNENIEYLRFHQRNCSSIRVDGNVVESRQGAANDFGLTEMNLQGILYCKFPTSLGDEVFLARCRSQILESRETFLLYCLGLVVSQ